ncbi:MAG TPA: hypothetical protein VGV07_01755 [Devosia sp.]|jgi:hypothetical protein|uniref:hypothetical protein n=1 Tax=Devosia sp. TaxID=1871048 RepID=UPI002DDCB614|nr:hypothetical protein [Devosia sp.]HEV2513947.1 hypothetical protein [Devosia sp.]
MLIRSLAVLALLLTPVASPLTAIRPALAQSQQIAVAELMRATALDEVFTQFAATIAASARAEEISSDEIFLKHWEATATSVFDAADLHRRLARALEGKFSTDEQAVLRSFFHSAFGERMTVLERDAARLEPGAQIAAIAAGQQLVTTASVIRQTQIDALMELVSAEISAAMVGQSVRALLLGLSVSHQQGEVTVPWQEIDTQVEAMMPGLLADVGRTQRAMMAYVYRDLSDADLDRYIEFLRTPAAQKFYAVAAYAVGRIVADGMSAFGEAFAARMQSVNV